VTGPQLGEGAIVTDLVARIAIDGSVTVMGTEEDRIPGADPMLTLRDVEGVLEGHVGVERAVARLDEGGVVVARVTGPRRRRPSEDELRALCHARLGEDGTPGRVRFVARVARDDRSRGRR